MGSGLHSCVTSWELTGVRLSVLTLFLLAQQLVQVNLPWVSILGHVVTGSGGHNVSGGKCLREPEFFRHK
jgi:hypothetical protein